MDLYYKNFAGVGVKPKSAPVLSEADFVQFIVSSKSVMENEEGLFLTKKALQTIAGLVVDDTDGKVSLTHGNRVFKSDETGNLWATVYLKSQGKKTHEGVAL